MNEGEDLKEMGRKIKTIRNDRKISLRELGELCDNQSALQLKKYNS